MDGPAPLSRPRSGPDTRTPTATPERTVAIVTGAGGMLGRAMTAQLDRRRWNCIAPPREVLDLARPETVRRFAASAADLPPSYVINCAGWTDVDAAEGHEAEAHAINATALRHLVGLCGPRTVLVAFGTDYVFDGRADRPYRSDHPRAPLNAYGRSKAEGESVLESLEGVAWLNVRTSWVYAPWGRNFVRTVWRLVRERAEVRIVDDQRGRPTSAEHLARTTLALLDRGARGHWHVCDGGECTWYELAAELDRLAGGAARLLPCKSADLPRKAARSAYSVLDLAATEALIGAMPHWKANLADVVPRLET